MTINLVVLLYTWDSSAILEEPEISDTTDWNIQIDENGGISFICLQCGDNSLEKLYSCPSGIDDVKFLLPLSDGNEIRRISQGMISHDEVYNFIEFYERYQQYYKGVPVLNDGRLYYLLTPKGKRMTSGWFSWFFDIKDLDVSPNITKDQAMDIVSEYTGIPINEYWDCEDLTIREFNSKPHLIYIICFPHIGPITSPVLGITAPTDIAYIDAHSGEILYTNYIKTSD